MIISFTITARYEITITYCSGIIPDDLYEDFKKWIKKDSLKKGYGKHESLYFYGKDKKEYFSIKYIAKLKEYK